MSTSGRSGEDLSDALATDGGSITARSGLVTARNVQQDRSEVAVKSGGLVVESEEVLLLSEEREFEYGELLRVEVEDEEPSPDDMGWLRNFIPSSASGSWQSVSPEERVVWAARGAEVLNTPMVSAVCDDSNLDMSLVASGSALLAAHGLKGAIELGLSKLRFLGLGEADLRESMDGFPLASNLMDLKSFGQRSCVTESFVPNGGVGFQQSKSYKENSAVCHKHLFELAARGLAMIVPWVEVPESDRRMTHVNPVQMAASSNPNGEGRCCINLSYQTPGPRHDRKAKSMSLNQANDGEASDALYPPTVLPNVRDICEMACQARARYEGEENLSVATIDIEKAYRQFQVSPEAILHRAIIIFVRGVALVIYTFGGWFGDKKAGHCYNVSGSYIDYKVNKDLRDAGHIDGTEKAAVTYIDDTALLGPDSKIGGFRGVARKHAKNVHGPECVAPRKDILWGQHPVVIGWEFDLRYDRWTVCPKPRAIDKIYAALHLVLPSNFCDEMAEVFVSRRVLIQVASLLSWYSVGLSVGSAFVHSLFKNAGYGSMNERRLISLNSKRDVGWWKAVSSASMRDPHVLAADISSLRTDLVPTVYVVGDASTSTGGGGWMGPSLAESSAVKQASFRWSIEELAAFEEFKRSHDGKPVDINVMEYFTIIFLVMLWGPELAGQRVGIRCDNTAAVAWLQKSRASNKSPVAEAMVHAFALYCIRMRIVLVPLHIKGVANVLADSLSRIISVVVQGAPEGAGVDTRVADWWKGLSREVILRNFLRASVAQPWRLPWQSTLRLLSHLQ